MKYSYDLLNMSITANHKIKDKSNRLQVYYMAQDEVLGFAQERSLMILCFNLRPVRSVNHHCMQALISEINISTIPNNT